MLESKRVCPKCGSGEIIEVGASRLMCQNCYHVFDKEKKMQEQQPPPSSGKLKKCLYCLQEKPVEEFKQGLCAECYPKFVKQAKQLEDEALARKIEQEERERKQDIILYPGLPAKQWPPEPLRKPVIRWFLIRFCFAAIFVAVALLAFFLFRGC